MAYVGLAKSSKLGKEKQKMMEAVILLVLFRGEINAQAYAKIHKGMTRQDVVKILGQPFQHVPIYDPCGTGGWRILTEGLFWSSENAGILVYFNRQERVIAVDRFTIRMKKK
jgi:hypothetical protein